MDRFDVVEMKLAGDLSDEVRRHGLDVLQAGVDEGVLAEQVGDARYSARIIIGGIHGLGGKDGLAVGSSYVQAGLNVLVGFVA